MDRFSIETGNASAYADATDFLGTHRLTPTLLTFLEMALPKTIKAALVKWKISFNL